MEISMSVLSFIHSAFCSELFIHIAQQNKTVHLVVQNA